MKIYLASTSPRRRELLKQIGVEFETLHVDVDESWDGTELPHDYVCRLALEKARATKQQEPAALPVLAADTAVVLDNEILGKAEDHEQAKAMLQRLSGRSHDVLSAVAVINTKEQTLLSTSKVSFKPLTIEEIEDYCASGEPIGKAGGYAVQGRAALFIERLEGSYSGVMGLPLYETGCLLECCGLYKLFKQNP